jgi:hypothetical protein
LHLGLPSSLADPLLYLVNEKMYAHVTSFMRAADEPQEVVTAVNAHPSNTIKPAYVRTQLLQARRSFPEISERLGIYPGTLSDAERGYNETTGDSLLESAGTALTQLNFI